MRKKVVMLGEMAVGKTSIVRRLTLDRFDGSYKGTIGHDIFVYKLSGLGPNQDQELDLAIFDTDGGLGAKLFQDNVAVRGATAAIIVGDVTRARTVATMAALAHQCDEHLPGAHVHFLLNKIDLLGTVDAAAVPAELAAFSHPIEKTSAETGLHVRKAFIDAANAVLRRGL